MTPDTLTFIQTVGFPIALVVYLLTRLEPRLERTERVASEKAMALEQAVRESAQANARAANSIRTAMREIRRAQLLYVQGHPSMSADVKAIAARMLNEQDEEDE